LELERRWDEETRKKKKKTTQGLFLEATTIVKQM